MAKKDKLWVYETIHHLEIYAETLEQAEKEKLLHEKATGMDFDLHPEWSIYQNEHDKESENNDN
jgi:hypothetical protein